MVTTAAQVVTAPLRLIDAGGRRPETPATAMASAASKGMTLGFVSANGAKTARGQGSWVVDGGGLGITVGGV